MENTILSESEREKYEATKYLYYHPDYPKRRIAAWFRCLLRTVSRWLFRFTQEITEGKSGEAVFIHEIQAGNLLVRFLRKQRTRFSIFITPNMMVPISLILRNFWKNTKASNFPFPVVEIFWWIDSNGCLFLRMGSGTNLALTRGDRRCHQYHCRTLVRLAGNAFRLLPVLSQILSNYGIPARFLTDNR